MAYLKLLAALKRHFPDLTTVRCSKCGRALPRCEAEVTATGPGGEMFACRDWVTCALVESNLPLGDA